MRIFGIVAFAACGGCGVSDVPATVATSVVPPVEVVDAATLVRAERPALVPPSSPPTTRLLASSAIAAAHPVHLATDGCAIRTVCEGTLCVEELAIGGHVAIAAKEAFAELRAEVDDPGREAAIDATEVALPRRSRAGFLSIYRIESDFTDGAAHAHNRFTCETYRATGARATLADVVDRPDDALAAAQHALGGVSGDAFEVTTEGLFLCANGDVSLARIRVR